MTVSTAQTVRAIQTAADATLNIVGYLGTFTVTNGTGSGANAGVISVGQGDGGPAGTLTVAGQIVNSGEIILYAGGDAANNMFVESPGVTLTGGGTVLLDGSKDFGDADVIQGVPVGGEFAADFTNVDNTIAGGGFIEADYLAFTNASKGVVDANNPTNVLLLSVYDGTDNGGRLITNAGWLEATGGGELSIGAVVIGNTGGVILASGTGSEVQVVDSTIEGGALKSSGGGEILLQGAPSVFDGSKSAVSVDGAVTIAADTIGDPSNGLSLKGRIDINGGSIVNNNATAISSTGQIVGVGTAGLIQSAVDNEGTLVANSGTLTIEGAVTGAGLAAIAAGTLDLTAAFGQNVTFEAGSTGTLELAHSVDYSGTISGFSTSGANALDLGDISYLKGTTTATFSGTTTGGILTVTDGTHTAEIKLTGDYTASTFTTSSDGNGGTIVVDPPAASAAHTPSPAAFVAAMAGVGAHSGTGEVSVSGASRSPSMILATPRTLPH